MAVIEPYAPCPCGSGEKYKWCCHKVEATAEKAHRLTDSGQLEAALVVLDDALRKDPAQPWLSIRKAIILGRTGKLKEAAEAVRAILTKKPDHVGARNFLARLTLELEGATAGVAALQDALSAVKPDRREALGLTAQVLGVLLVEQEHAPAALAHLHLAEFLSGETEEGLIEQSVRMIERNPSLPAWTRNPYELAPPPEGADPAVFRRFQEALDWAGEGLWASAASAFETLSADRIPGADKNLGLLRLWLTEDGPAAEALRRHIAEAGETEDAVDLEALCQTIAPPARGDRVERVQLTWPIRDRAALLKKLEADPTIDSEGKGPSNPENPESPEAEFFAMLDRPKVSDVAGKSPQELPQVVARVIVHADTVALDLLDAEDRRLDRLSARFVDLAAPAIPPAHPKTKVIERLQRSSEAMRSEMWLPAGVSREESNRLTKAEHTRIIREVWPRTRLPYLDGKTPKDVNGDRAYQVPLRAALCQFEFGQEFWRGAIDFAAFRREMGIDPEPEIDPETVDIDRLHIGRLHRVPADRLDDQKLIILFLRSHSYVLPLAMERAGRALADRPHLLGGSEIDRVLVFGDLANLALSRQARDEAFEWVRKGRSGDTDPNNLLRWEFVELRLRSRTESPESWVPALAVLLERFSDSQTMPSPVFSNLLDMGLIQMRPNPDNPDQMLLDTRPLQSVLAKYGPKITTASGRLGVSATQGSGIWTPGGETSGAPGGGIWTPGAGPPPAAGGEKSKLIIPGR